MNSTKYIIITSLCLVSSCAPCVFAQQSHQARVTVQVKDNDGNPVSGVEVGASTMSGHKAGPEFGTDEYRTVTGKTDANGSTTLTIPCFVDYGNVSMGVAYGVMVGAEPKPGFYQSDGLSYGIHFTNVVSGEWQPWRPTLEVIMQKVGIQVPLYARHLFKQKIPVQDKPCGFDLMVGDWVAPYGKGEMSDFVFQLQQAPIRSFTNALGSFNIFDYKLTVGFSNESDGLQLVSAIPHSILRLPRQAPLDGYVHQLVKRWYNKEDGSEYSGYQKDANYYFRVRTKKDEQENTVSALYGKIAGDLGNCIGSPTPILFELNFTYYLNPEPNSRKMEFNPQQNLFTNLPPLERVSAP